MSYTILKTDGTALTSVVDGTIDQTTDLTLVGKNTSGYGIFFNENFVHLLENFSNTTEPNHPIQGQLWYDTTQNRLKVYNGTQFVVSGGTVVSSTPPSGIAAGDLWVDNVREQLYFNDGISTMLAGPLYTAQQGISGFNVEDILDTNNVNHTIVYLWVAQTLLGVFSKDAFTPITPIAGLPESLNVGFTASTTSSLLFNVVASKANQLVAATGDLKSVEDFVSTSDDSQSTGTISILNSTPLILGPGANTEFDVGSSAFQIKSNSSGQNFSIQTLSSGGQQTAFFINSTSQKVGIFTNNPTTTLDVNGDVTVQGALTVKGATTLVNSTTIQLTDKNIELATPASGSPTDILADGGGITLHGTSDKTLNWVSSTSSWTSSEHVNLASGKSYKINGTVVLSSSSLGSGISSAPGLTSIGTLANVQVANIGINSNIVSYVNPVTPNGNVVLQPKGTGSVDVNSTTIINVATPVNGTDAANKNYVTTLVQSAPLAISLTVGARSNTQIASDFLSKIFPYSEHAANTIVRVFVTDDSSVRQFTLQGSPGTWTYQLTL